MEKKSSRTEREKGDWKELIAWYKNRRSRFASPAGALCGMKNYFRSFMRGAIAEFVRHADFTITIKNTLQ